MSKNYYVSQTDLKSVADKIRSVKGISSELIFPAEFIINIPTVPQLHAVSITLENNTLTINNPSTNGDFATKFIIQGNGEILDTTSETSIDLTTIIPSAGEYSITVLAAGENFKNSEASNIVTYTTASYTITTTITNGTYSGSETIDFKGTAEVVLTPNSEFKLPETITVTNISSYNYDNTTGIITLKDPTGDVTITAVCEGIVYTITTTISHGSYTGDATILPSGTATVNIVPESGYTYPSDITITGATYSYDNTTGIISLSKPTGEVVITGDCVIYPSLAAPTIILSDDILGILDNDSKTTQFDIYSGGECKATIDKIS